MCVGGGGGRETVVGKWVLQGGEWGRLSFRNCYYAGQYLV